MANLHWTVELEGQEAPITGAVASPAGAVRVRPDLPAGTLRRVAAAISWRTGKDQRLFFNGYQTWTYSPEYTWTDRIRGLRRIPRFLVNKFGLDRYGDYHFVDYPFERGCFHGFSWCYFRTGGDYRLAASLDERPGYTIFRYDAAHSLLTIERDCAGVEWAGGEFPAFDLYFGEGTEDQVFDGWFAAMGVTPRTDKRLVGWSSWYDRYEDIDEASVASALSGCARLLSPGDLFQIDDGWEPAVGDWLAADPKKFPGGMKAQVDAIHEQGFLAGLWLAPFVCETESEIYRQHPDWLLRWEGEPWKCGCNWSNFYALDIDLPAVQEHLKGVFDRVLNEWGFDLVKLDFLYGAAPFGTARESRGGRMLRAMELLRSWCGDKLILGCGVPVMPAFGLVDYCRVSCDVGLDWNDKPIMRIIHRERVSTRQAIGNTVLRRQLNGRAYGSDPDVFFLRTENCKLSDEEKRRLYTANALFSQILLTSDDPSRYTPQQMDLYREVLALRDAADVRVDPDRGVVSFTLHGQRREERLW